jgi:glycosyltransferase involved in cell wall biosynthesis
VIVFCHLLNDNSGSPVVLKATIESFTSNNKNILYIGSQGRGLLDKSNIQIRRYWYLRNQLRFITVFSYFFSQIFLFLALVKANDIPKNAIVYVNTLLPFGAMIWGKLSARLVIVHIHETSVTPACLRWLLLNCARICASQLIYVSNYQLKQMPIKGVPYAILPNPVGLHILKKIKSYAHRRSGRFNILMLCSLSANKGVPEFMNLANSLIFRKDIDFTLVLNAELEDVNFFISKYPKAFNVKVQPRSNDPGIYYQNADLVLNLSRVDMSIESFGLTIVESMSYGIPVIVPPVGGPAAIITNSIEGFCIDSRNLNALIKAVLTLVDNPSLAMAMSEAALNCSKNFTFEIYAKKIREIFQNVQEKRRYF